MTEDEKKKKKGVAIVIAVTPHAPKKPEDTMKPDEKMEKAWTVLKDWRSKAGQGEADIGNYTGAEHEYDDEGNFIIDDDERAAIEAASVPIATRRLRNQMIIDNEKNNWPEGVERSLDDEGNILLDGIPHDEYKFPPPPPPEEDDPMEPWMDEPLEKAWKFLKEELDPRVTGGVPAKSLKDKPGQLERILGDLEDSRDFGLGIQGKPTQRDFQDKLSDVAQGYVGDEDEDYNLFEGHGVPTKPSEIPVEDPMDDVREEEEREEKLAEGVDPEEHKLDGSPDEDPLGMFSTTSDPIFNSDGKYHKKPSNPFGKTPMEGAWDSLSS